MILEVRFLLFLYFSITLPTRPNRDPLGSPIRLEEVDMARKRKGEMYEQMRFEREQESRKIQEEFPEVAHLRISLTFEDHDNQDGGQL